MLSPWLAPRLNFTAIALPAFTELTTGRLSTGWKKPVTLNPPLPKFQWLACDVRTVICAPVPSGTLDAMHGSGDAPATKGSQFPTGASFLSTATAVGSAPPSADPSI